MREPETLRRTDTAFGTGSVSQRHVLEVLAGLPVVDQDGIRRREHGLTAAEVARELHLHVSTARFHLERLVANRDLTSSFHRTGVGRPQKRYALATGRPSVPQRERYLRMLTELLLAALKPSQTHVSGEQAGRRWALEHVVPHPRRAADRPLPSLGEWLGKVGQIVDVLAAWGYQPELATQASGNVAVITLQDCPFRDLAVKDPEVVCGVHRGLIQGSLESLGETNVLLDLKPLVRGDHCVAQLIRTKPFAEEA